MQVAASNLSLALARLKAIAPDVQLSNISPETRAVWQGYVGLIAARRRPSIAQQYVRGLFPGVYRG
jgi:hypothetical protein